jgi:drug/metabolite transporter (DMT)-like permease
LKKIGLTDENKTLISWLLLFFLAMVWGFSFILVKKVVVSFTALELGAGRIFIASVALLPWAIKYFKVLPSSKIKPLMLSGLLGYLLPAIIFGYVGSRLNSSLSGTLNATTPLFVLIVGVLFFSKRIEKFQVIGLSIAFIGSLVLILSGGENKLDFNNPFAILVVFATLMYGFNVNILGRYLWDLKPIMISAFSLFFVGIISLVCLLFTDFFFKIFLPENLHLLFYFLILGAVNSGLAAVLFNYILQISSPVFASSVTYLIPVVATLAGLFDGEKIGLWHYAGMLFILLGIYMLNKPQKLIKI